MLGAVKRQHHSDSISNHCHHHHHHHHHHQHLLHHRHRQEEGQQQRPQPHHLQHQQHHHDYNHQHHNNGVLSWLLTHTIGPFENDLNVPASLAKTASKAASTTIPISKTISTSLSLATFFRKFSAIFFIVMMLVATCCDARMLNANRINIPRTISHRSVRAAKPSAQHPSLANPSNPSSHSTNNLMPSILPSSSSSTSSSSSSASSSSSTKDNIPGGPQPSYTSSNSNGQGGADSMDLIPESASKEQLISVLISTLERLNALEVSSTSCNRLVKIVKKHIDDPSLFSSSSSLSPSSVHHNTFGVYLYFEEIPHNAMHSAHVNNNTTFSNKPLPVGSSNADSGSNDDASVLKDSCVSDPIIDVVMATPDNNNNNNDNNNNNENDLVSENGHVEDVTTVENGTLVDNDDDEASHTGVYGILQTGKLSRTQIVVISTCSAIIGMFFLVAAILRIRNYIKRIRMEQALARRPKFRSCSVALRGATQSMEQLRRDSLASKTSHQNSVTTNRSNGSQTNGSSRENSSSSSPRHDPDTAPLLLITRAPQLNDMSTPTESHSSLQYIDEEAAPPKKKVLPPSSLARNGNIDNNCAVRYVQGYPQALTAERANSLKRSYKLPLHAGTGEISRSPKQNGDVVRCLQEGSVNPSFSSGSIGYHLVSNMDDGYGRMNRSTSAELQRRGLETICDGRMKLDPYYEKFYRGSKKRRGRRRSVEWADRTHSPEYLGHSLLETVCTPRRASMSEARLGEVLPSSVKAPLRNFLSRKGEPATVNSKDRGVTISKDVSSECKVDTPDVDMLSPLTESSYFGLSQSDASISSITNQGNEFSGQREYQPGDSIAVPDTETCIDTASSYENHNDNCDNIQMRRVDGEGGNASQNQNSSSNLTSANIAAFSERLQAGKNTDLRLEPTMNSDDKSSINISGTNVPSISVHPADSSLSSFGDISLSSNANISESSLMLQQSIERPASASGQISDRFENALQCNNAKSRSAIELSTPNRSEIPELTAGNDGTQAAIAALQEALTSSEALHDNGMALQYQDKATDPNCQNIPEKNGSPINMQESSKVQSTSNKTNSFHGMDEQNIRTDGHMQGRDFQPQDSQRDDVVTSQEANSPTLNNNEICNHTSGKTLSLSPHSNQVVNSSTYS